MPPLVIGCGNGLRSDDGAASVLIEAARLALPPEAAEWLVCHQLTTELVPVVAKVQRVIFVDAAACSPGCVSVKKIYPSSESLTTLSHHLTPQILLAMTLSLCDREPEAWLLTIGGEEFGLGEQLSEAVQHALPEALRQLCDLLC